MAADQQCLSLLSKPITKFMDSTRNVNAKKMTRELQDTFLELATKLSEGLESAREQIKALGRPSPSSEQAEHFSRQHADFLPHLLSFIQHATFPSFEDIPKDGTTAFVTASTVIYTVNTLASVFAPMMQRSTGPAILELFLQAQALESVQLYVSRLVTHVEQNIPPSSRELFLTPLDASRIWVCKTIVPLIQLEAMVARGPASKVVRAISSAFLRDFCNRAVEMATREKKLPDTSVTHVLHNCCLYGGPAGMRVVDSSACAAYLAASLGAQVGRPQLPVRTLDTLQLLATLIIAAGNSGHCRKALCSARGVKHVVALLRAAATADPIHGAQVRLLCIVLIAFLSHMDPDTRQKMVDAHVQDAASDAVHSVARSCAQPPPPLSTEGEHANVRDPGMVLLPPAELMLSSYLLMQLAGFELLDSLFWAEILTYLGHALLIHWTPVHIAHVIQLLRRSLIRPDLSVSMDLDVPNSTMFVGNRLERQPLLNQLGFDNMCGRAYQAACCLLTYTVELTQVQRLFRCHIACHHTTKILSINDWMHPEQLVRLSRAMSSWALRDGHDASEHDGGHSMLAFCAVSNLSCLAAGLIDMQTQLPLASELPYVQISCLHLVLAMVALLDVLVVHLHNVAKLDRAESVLVVLCKSVARLLNNGMWEVVLASGAIPSIGKALQVYTRPDMPNKSDPGALPVTQLIVAITHCGVRAHAPLEGSGRGGGSVAVVFAALEAGMYGAGMMTMLKHPSVAAAVQAAAATGVKGRGSSSSVRGVATTLVAADAARFELRSSARDLCEASMRTARVGREGSELALNMEALQMSLYMQVKQIKASDDMLKLLSNWASLKLEVDIYPTDATHGSEQQQERHTLAAEEGKMRNQIHVGLVDKGSMAPSKLSGTLTWRDAMAALTAHAMEQLHELAISKGGQQKQQQRGMLKSNVEGLNPALVRYWVKFVAGLEALQDPESEATTAQLQPRRWYEEQSMAFAVKAGCCNMLCAGRAAAGGKPGAVSMCAGCNKMWFCSRACQMAEWKHHRPLCKRT